MHLPSKVHFKAGGILDLMYWNLMPESYLLVVIIKGHRGQNYLLHLIILHRSIPIFSRFNFQLMLNI